MKKFLSVLALLLSVVMIFSLASCSFTQPKDNVVDSGNKDPNKNDPNGDKTPCTNHTDANKDGKCDTCGATVEVTPPVCTAHTDADKDGKCDTCGVTVEVTPPACTTHTDANEDGKCDNCGAAMPEPEPEPEIVTFEERDETVYVNTSSLNVRKEADFDSDIVGNLTLGQGVKRIGYHKTYSKILYDNDNDPATAPIEAYVATKYVTTELVSDSDFTVLEKPDAVYVTAGALNMRALPNASADILLTLVKGDELTRISYGEKWTKVSYTYTDKETNKDVTITGYVNSKYIAEKAPSTPSEPETPTVTDKKFTVDDFSITLTTEFIEMQESTSSQFGYETEKIGIIVIRDLIADIEAAEGVELDRDSTLEEYLEVVKTLNGIDATVTTSGGLTYYIYNTEVADATYTNLTVAYKSIDSFWLVQFLTDADDYATLKQTLTTYALSVEVR